MWSNTRQTAARTIMFIILNVRHYKYGKPTMFYIIFRGEFMLKCQKRKECKNWRLPVEQAFDWMLFFFGSRSTFLGKTVWDLHFGNLGSDCHCFLPTMLTTLMGGWKQTIWRICNLVFQRSVHRPSGLGTTTKFARQSWYRAPYQENLVFNIPAHNKILVVKFFAKGLFSSDAWFSSAFRGSPCTSENY